ncbi:MAG: type II toxin-antitoxin system VapC family toxin [Alphaproteobacteria bacterium]|nr:type II toxin-antitoxin system VapC family toxin [Alphaproteobacteria bacterium]
MYLFDTHALLWALADDARLGPEAREVFLDDRAPVLVSAASIWEMSIKVGLGKLKLGRPLPRIVGQDLDALGIPVLPVEARHALGVEALPPHHRDPFDRLLAATALVDQLVLVSSDPVFPAYGVRVTW